MILGFLVLELPLKSHDANFSTEISSLSSKVKLKSERSSASGRQPVAKRLEGSLRPWGGSSHQYDSIYFGTSQSLMERKESLDKGPGKEAERDIHLASMPIARVDPIDAKLRT